MNNLVLEFFLVSPILPESHQSRLLAVYRNIVNHHTHALYRKGMQKLVKPAQFDVPSPHKKNCMTVCIALHVVNHPEYDWMTELMGQCHLEDSLYMHGLKEMQGNVRTCYLSP